jgi:hypothetical protein
MPSTIDVFKASRAMSYAGIVKRGVPGAPMIKSSLLKRWFGPSPIITARSTRAAERGMVDPIPERSVFDVRFSTGLDPKGKTQPEMT